MNIQVQFSCLWSCASPNFLVQINDFFCLVLFSVVIYKRRKDKQISKAIKYKLDSSSKMQFTFFYPKHIQKLFWRTIDFVEIWKWRNQQGGEGFMLFASLWRNVYENRYVIHLYNPLTLLINVTITAFFAYETLTIIRNERVRSFDNLH